MARNVARFLPLICLLFAQPAWAVGELMISPTRVVIEGRQRSATLYLVNRGQETSTYRLSFIRQRMTEDGKFQLVEKPLPGEQFSDEMIRFAPKEVTLPPGGSQTVRMMVRKPANLPDGEYRSHLQFRLIPQADEIGKSVDRLFPSQKGIRVRLTPIFGVTIPVIVRQGLTSASLRLADLKLEQSNLDLHVLRDGNRSLYGDLVASWVPKGGKSTLIGEMKGLAIYAPNSSRYIRLPLQIPKGLVLKQGRLDVVFKDDDGVSAFAKLEQ